MARRFPVLAFYCSNFKPADANATVNVDKTFEIWARQIVTEFNVAPVVTSSALLQIARRMTNLTWQFKQDYKKDPDLEDIVCWTTGVEEVLDGVEIEVDHVPMNATLVNAVEALDFALI
jgi:hypothetical protein